MISDPSDDPRSAYLIAAVPSEATTRRHKQLFGKAFTHHATDGYDTISWEDVNERASDWVIKAWKPSYRTSDKHHPLSENIETASLHAALAALCVNHHPELSDVDPSALQGVANLCELYSRTVTSLISRHESETLYQDLAELLYAKSPDQGQVHPGRVCTGVGPVKPFETNRHYVEIPVVAASEACIVRATEDGWGGDYKHTGKTVDGTLLTRVHDNNVYVPLGHLEAAIVDSIKDGGFGTLIKSLEKSMDEERIGWITSRATGAKERIDRFVQNGQYDALYTSFDQEKQTAQLIRNAIAESDIETDAGVSPSEVYQAISEYDTDTPWDERRASEFQSPTKTERILDELAQGGNLSKDEGLGKEPAKYSLPVAPSDLSITTPDDLFQLPCFANMAERLNEKGPVRKDLFNFVTTVMWLPQYRDASEDEVVEDIKAVFKQWPWYDEDESDYQIRYAYRRRTGDSTEYLPMGCDNDDMQRYCIGKDVCPYSIYGSVPFADELYDQLNSDGSSMEF